MRRTNERRELEAIKDLWRPGRRVFFFTWTCGGDLVPFWNCIIWVYPWKFKVTLLLSKLLPFKLFFVNKPICLILWIGVAFLFHSLCSLPMFLQIHLDHHSFVCYYMKSNQNLQSLALKRLSVSAILLSHFGPLYTIFPSQKKKPQTSPNFRKCLDRATAVFIAMNTNIQQLQSFSSLLIDWKERQLHCNMRKFIDLGNICGQVTTNYLRVFFRTEVLNYFHSN